MYQTRRKSMMIWVGAGRALIVKSGIKWCGVCFWHLAIPRSKFSLVVWPLITCTYHLHQHSSHLPRGGTNHLGKLGAIRNTPVSRVITLFQSSQTNQTPTHSPSYLVWLEEKKYLSNICILIQSHQTGLSWL